MELTEGTLPFIYLGVPIIKGATKKVYFKKTMEKICAKFESWKGMFLSMAGGLQLVHLMQSVVQGMMVYTMKVYQWPKYLLHMLQRFINNFIWTGDIHKRGVATVKWKNICKPIEEKGLGIRCLVEFNDVCMAVLAVQFLKGKNTWCSWVSNRFYPKGVPIQYYKSSLVWRGIRYGLQLISIDICYIVGRRASLSLWNGCWLEG